MKRHRILLLAILVLVITYFMLDRHLFYYGKNDFNLYSSLPLKIQPEYRFDNQGQFVLRDKFGFSIVGQGNSYKFNNTNIVIQEVFKYGFNSEKLVAVVEDKKRHNYNVEFSAEGGDPLNDEIRARVYANNSTSKMNSYKWIELKGKESYIEKIEILRNYIMFITISLLIWVLVLSVSRNRKKSE